MKLKVIQDFHDKDTDELYRVGKIIEVDEKRGKELLSNPLLLVEKVIENREKSTRKSKKSN